MELDSTFWVAVALFLFLGLLGWLNVHRMIAKALDQRSATISEQLEQARNLREEAQSLLAQQQRREREAASQAKELIENAEREAKLITAEAERELEELIARRTSMAHEKIAQAEVSAIKEVRQIAVRAATAAAAELIAAHLKGPAQKELVDDAIASLDTASDKRLH